MAAQSTAYKMEVCISLTGGMRCTEERKLMQLHQPGAPELSYTTPEKFANGQRRTGCEEGPICILLHVGLVLGILLVVVLEKCSNVTF